MSRRVMPASQYPGTPAPSVGLLRHGAFRPLRGDCRDEAVLSAALTAAGVVPLSERTLVVAVGSNAVPAVIHRKLSVAGRCTIVPFTPCTVAGIAVGHSAHVSAAGYIPAAPFAQPNVSTPMIASWFDTEQLQAVDATEPNYRRRHLPGARYPLTLATGQRPAHFALYESLRGLLTLDGSTPVPLTTQHELCRRLRESRRSTGHTCPSGLSEQE